MLLGINEEDGVVLEKVDEEIGSLKALESVKESVLKSEFNSSAVQSWMEPASGSSPSE